MTNANEETPALCAPLDSILGNELRLGNEIGEIQKGLWSKMDTVVVLKFPFRQTHPTGAEIVFHRNTDSHYSLTESYSSEKFRQAVEAPY